MRVRPYLAQMRVLTCCSRPLPAAMVVASVLVAGMLVGVQPASSEIGIESVNRTSGAAGDEVDLVLYCGGCLPRTVRLPISLLPAGDSPGRQPCRGTSCARRAPAPPGSAPYVPLGTAVSLAGGPRLARRLGLEIPDAVRRHGAGAIRRYVASANRLRFRIPNVEPGLYTYVIHCEGCVAGRGGSLIGHPEPRASRNVARLAHARKNGEFLRIVPAASRDDGSGGTPWILWTVITALALGLLFVVWWRRGTRPG
jgi:hypothetical protein